MSPPTTRRTSEDARPELDDKPPVLGAWRNIYALVLGVLLLDIVVFALITQAYK